MKIVDRLSRDLALGVSRRKALWMFLAGTGAVAVGGEKKALASTCDQSRFLCADSCTRQAEAFLELCMAASEECPNGYCAEFTMLKVNTTGIRINTTQIRVNGSNVYTFDETCTPVCR